MKSLTKEDLDYTDRYKKYIASKSEKLQEMKTIANKLIENKNLFNSTAKNIPNQNFLDILENNVKDCTEKFFSKDIEELLDVDIDDALDNLKFLENLWIVFTSV